MAPPDIGTALHAFHFLRPLWLLATLPALAVTLAIARRRQQAGSWREAVDADLLPHLLGDETGNGRERWPLALLLAGWCLAAIALAGPVWERLPQPVARRQDALVIIQDLSLSLYASDLAPDRLTRARHKLTDILRGRREGTTALVIYAGDAHVVCPLTDDTATILAMLPALTPDIMPSYGSNLPAAVRLALGLFTDAAVHHGRILLLTDGVTEPDVDAVKKILADHDTTLSVLGVGTADGGPIPKDDGGFFKDDQGRIIVPKMDEALLTELAAAGRGRYRPIRLDDQDIRQLLAQAPLLPGGNSLRRVNRRFDQWQEEGAWLVLLLLPLALGGFRRGWLLTLILLIPLLGPADCHAFAWQDLWQRPDQQGAAALAHNDPKAAARLFRAPGWQGAARYLAGDFNGAAAAFANDPSARGAYNRGTALARAGRLAEAANAFAEALRLDPGMRDAAFNKKLVEQALRQQQQQRQQNGQGKGANKQGSGRNAPDKDKNVEKGQDHDQHKGQPQKDQQGTPDDRQQNRQGRQDHASAGNHDQKKTDEQRTKAAQPPPAPQAGRQEGTPAGPRPDAGTGKKAATGAEAGKTASPKNDKKGAAEADRPLTRETEQAMEQWLREIPDDPGGLLRRKFEYQYRRNHGHRQDGLQGPIW